MDPQYSIKKKKASKKQKGDRDQQYRVANKQQQYRLQEMALLLTSFIKSINQKFIFTKKNQISKSLEKKKSIKIEPSSLLQQNSSDRENVQAYNYSHSDPAYKEKCSRLFNTPKDHRIIEETIEQILAGQHLLQQLGKHQFLRLSIVESVLAKTHDIDRKKQFKKFNLEGLKNYSRANLIEKYYASVYVRNAAFKNQGKSMAIPNLAFEKQIRSGLKVDHCFFNNIQEYTKVKYEQFFKQINSKRMEVEDERLNKLREPIIRDRHKSVRRKILENSHLQLHNLSPRQMKQDQQRDKHAKIQHQIRYCKQIKNHKHQQD